MNQRYVNYSLGKVLVFTYSGARKYSKAPWKIVRISNRSYFMEKVGQQSTSAYLKAESFCFSCSISFCDFSASILSWIVKTRTSLKSAGNLSKWIVVWMFTPKSAVLFYIKSDKLHTIKRSTCFECRVTIFHGASEYFRGPPCARQVFERRCIFCSIRYYYRSR